MIPCPVCGSTNILSKTESNGIYGPGGRTYKIYDYCTDCGVLLNIDRKEIKSKVIGVVKIPKRSKASASGGSIFLSPSGKGML
jgi:hypothetical protein